MSSPIPRVPSGSFSVSDRMLDSIARALHRFTVLSPLAFSIDGEPPLDARAWATTPADDPLTGAITGVFYDRCYAGRRAGAPRAGAPDMMFAAGLDAANQGQQRWDIGWRLTQFGPGGQILIQKGDAERLAMPGSYILDAAPGVPPRIGSPVRILLPRGSFELQPGYYFAFGEMPEEAADALDLTRIYFHCAAAAAAGLVLSLTEALNRFQVPFQLKVPSAPSLFDRRDTAVLYVSTRYFAITARLIALARCQVTLLDGEPLFAKTLWPGIAAAANPGPESFGMHRSRLAAEAIVVAWRRGRQDVAARLDALRTAFARVGLDVERPWTGAGGVDQFTLPEEARLP